MEQNSTDTVITVQEIKEMESFKDLTDEEAQTFAASLHSFCLIIYEAWADSERQENVISIPDQISLAA